MSEDIYIKTSTKYRLIKRNLCSMMFLTDGITIPGVQRFSRLCNSIDYPFNYFIYSTTENKKKKKNSHDHPIVYRQIQTFNYNLNINAHKL